MKSFTLEMLLFNLDTELLGCQERYNGAEEIMKEEDENIKQIEATMEKLKEIID